MKVILIANGDDTKRYPVEQKVAELSTLIKNMISDLNADGAIEEFEAPLPNVDEDVLIKIIEWCEHHKDETYSDDEYEVEMRKKLPVEEWDKKFLEEDEEMWFKIMLAANYMVITPLLDIGCKLIADLLNGLTASEMARILPAAEPATEANK
ncbi:uncharacterized protein RJT20DRAFT_1345 [Scheffersomyces xylosifermentans]|uniref:uncharacterized protein n=1 Tax=Scheffersomyces xylosifermentans TaxID=1304137 RepID=UPI00315DE732